MPLEYASFAFLVTLAAVVNGLGIVRWLTSFAEQLRHKDSLGVQHYWVFSLYAGFQFLLHILMWWLLWGVRGGGEINFLMYVYVLTGPILLFFGTSMLVPNIKDDTVDMKTHYFAVRQAYSTVLALLWLWAIFMSPVLHSEFAPTLPIFALFLVVALTQRIMANPRIQGVLAALNWLLLVVFVATYAMQLGEISR
jgi:hypothetical protein